MTEYARNSNVQVSFMKLVAISNYRIKDKSLLNILYCIVLIALSRCNRVFTRRLRLCHSHTVRRREVRKGDREGLNRVVSEQ